MIFKSRHEIMADYYLNKTILDIKLNRYPEEINSIGLNIENKDLITSSLYDVVNY